MTGAITRATDAIIRTPHQTAYLLAIIASLIIIFVLDSLTPLGVSVWALYIFPLILSSHFSTHWAPFVTAAVCSILTVAGYLTSPIVMDMQAMLPLFNRGIILGVYWIVAVLVVRQQGITDQLVRVATLEAENKAHLLRQDALRKSADEIYDLYNNAPCGYFSLDSEGRFVAINQTTLDWLGYMRNEIVEKKQFVDLLTPAGARTFHDNFPRFLRDGDIHDLEFDSVRKDGSTLPVLLNGTTIKDADNRFVASRMTMIDMTDRKRAADVLRQAHDSLEAQVRERTAQLAIANEQLERKLKESKRIEDALRASENRFRVMADHAPVLIWISDTTKGCTWFNKPWLAFVGRSMEQELGNGWAENVHSDDFAHCLKTYDHAFDARQEFTMEYRLRRWDGEWCWVLDHGVPRYETDGAFAGYIGSCIDITELKRSEAAARESEERLSGIIGSAMDAIITIDEQHRITDFNSSAEHMFEWDAPGAIGQSIDRFIPERFRATHASHIAAFGNTAVSKRQMGELGTIYGLRANGKEFPIEASISQLTTQGKKFYTVILRDVSQRRQAEEALRASERHFRELIESIPQLVWTCRPDGPCDYLSPQWVRYTGTPEDQQLGIGWLEQLHPDDRERVITQWMATLKESHQFETEFRLRRRDGLYRWFQTRAIPFRDAHGVIIKWFGTNTDIHDRKQAEEVQGRLGAIVESSDDAIISKSLDGLVQTWNQGAERMFGYAAEEIIGKPILTLIPSERHQEETAIMRNIQDGHQFQHFETVRRRKDGSLLDVSLVISPVKNADGAVIAISKIARDISARKRTEETLRQHNRLIELSHEPILVWDLDSGITEWNRGCTQLYGYTSAEAIGQSNHGLLCTQFPCPFPDILSTLLSTGEWSGEVRHRAKSGNEVVVESSWGLLETHGRKLVLETNRDITERKKAERSLLRKNKDLETLLHVTSHDLKEPLRSIESFSHLVQERYADRLDTKGQDYLRRVVRAAQRLDRLLTDILDLSRAQRMETPLEEVGAEVIIGDVLKRLENRSKETGAHITVASPLPRLRVNRIWATQGLYNLVANALKFTRTGQTPDIEIASYFKQDTVTGEQSIGLTVKDRGPGVQPDQRDRIFQLFQRAVGREIEGTGAGLAIVRQVAERHDGQAWVQPREGGGSEFIITFGHGILMPDRG